MVVFMTGGAAGLGLGTLRLLHAQGAKVAIADLNIPAMEHLKHEFPKRFLFFKCDVSQEEQVKEAIENTVKEWGTIHVAIASAGISPTTFIFS